MTTTNKYDRRDRLGRFVRRMHRDEVELAGEFVNDANGVTHGHIRCGNLSKYTYVVEPVRDGWLCEACIDVPAPLHLKFRNHVSKEGMKMCDTCFEILQSTKFPTVVVGGWRTRGETCRKCETALKGTNPSRKPTVLMYDLT